MAHHESHTSFEDLKETAKLTTIRPTIGDVWNRYIIGRAKLSPEMAAHRKCFSRS